VIRNFVAGLVWGAVVAGLGLVVISQVAPLPAPVVVQDKAPAPVEPVVAVPETAVPEAVVSQPATSIAAPDAVVAEAPAPETEVIKDAAPAEALAQPAIAAPAAPSDAPKTPTSPEPAQAVPGLAADQTAPMVPGRASPPDSQGSDPAPAAIDLPPPPPAETDEALLTPAPPPAAQPEPALVTPEAVPAAPDMTAPEATLPDSIPEAIAPDTSLPRMVDGVTTDRLPAIGKPEPASEPALASQDPIDRFARPFDNPGAKPMFALVLLDSGAPDLDRARLAALPFPVTFVIDPASANAAAAAQIYRAAGQEVVMLASGIPAGASAADLEQTFQALATTLPEAVAVLDLPTGGFQDDRPLATLVVPVLKDQGRGLLTYDRGLNAADQVARRDGVRAATIFRMLDAEGEDTPLIRRYLDRAAFKAAQEGRVVVLGQTRDETVAAILEWTVEGRASSVALAPLTAVLITPN
jgi:polysaccharide deacetylase 2 family uncharacterized protein YibQ